LIWDWSGKLLLHDIRNDPYETRDLAGENPELATRLYGTA
jgi:hypothetical protein